MEKVIMSNEVNITSAETINPEQVQRVATAVVDLANRPNNAELPGASGHNYPKNMGFPD
jgi:hypothetical protein